MAKRVPKKKRRKSESGDSKPSVGVKADLTGIAPGVGTLPPLEGVVSPTELEGARGASEDGDESDGGPERLFDDTQIGNVLRELWAEQATHLARLRTRRMLLDLAQDAVGDPSIGTYLPKPYDKSKLILKTLIGDPLDVLRNYTARVSANEPQVSVIPVAAERRTLAKRVENRAAEQERLLMSMWQANGGRQAQYQVAWSQSWGRAGWYLTLPREATWGLPDRAYYDDLTDGEIEAMRRSGKIAPEPVAGEDGGAQYAESASNWMERRRAAAAEQAISGKTLVTLEAIAPDMVLPRYDRDGTARRSLKYAFVIEELPASDFAPGTELARAAAEAAGVPEGELDRYGLYSDRDGRIQGGVTRGGEPHSASNSGKQRWTLARFVTRDEVYYYVTTNPASGAGQTIWHERHGAGKVPLVPVPGMYTDSSQPGGEYSSLMESVFALTPILNQIETLLSNVATWNALGRFVVEDVDGRLVAGDDGEPLIMSTDDMVGLDPQDVSIVRGHIRQLTIDASLLLQLLDFYSRRLDQSKPAPVTEGQAGASAAAWQVRLLLEASGELLGQAVSNHAEAVKEVMLLWVRWLRMLDEPVFVFGIPGKRKDRETVRGLIEFEPSDLVESLHVAQSAQSAQQRVVLQQAGIELLRAGRIDDRQYYEEFALADDPEEAELRAIVQQVKQAVLFGDVSAAPPGSVLGDVVQAVRGRITMQMLDQSPNFAMASAEQMAQQSSAAAQQAQAAAMGQAQGQPGGVPSGPGPQVPNPQNGNFAAAMGVREPGMGMGIDLPGDPVPPGIVTP